MLHRNLLNNELKLAPLMSGSYEISDTEEMDHETKLINDSSLLSLSNQLSTPSTIHQLQHSMSDDDIYHYTSNYNSDDVLDDEAEQKLTAAQLKSKLSSNRPLRRKRTKQRSNSTIIGDTDFDKYHQKWKTLKKQYKMQADQVRLV